MVKILKGKFIFRNLSPDGYETENPVLIKIYIGDTPVSLPDIPLLKFENSYFTKKFSEKQIFTARYGGEIS